MNSIKKITLRGDPMIVHEVGKNDVKSIIDITKDDTKYFLSIFLIKKESGKNGDKLVIWTSVIKEYFNSEEIKAINNNKK